MDDRAGEIEKEDESGNGSTENGQQDGHIEEGRRKGGPPKPTGFWDPRLKHVRHEAMTKWLITSMLTTGHELFTFLTSSAIVLMVFILSILSLCKYELLLDNFLLLTMLRLGRAFPRGEKYQIARRLCSRHGRSCPLQQRRDTNCRSHRLPTS